MTFLRIFVILGLLLGACGGKSEKKKQQTSPATTQTEDTSKDEPSTRGEETPRESADSTSQEAEAECEEDNYELVEDENGEMVCAEVETADKTDLSEDKKENSGEKKGGILDSAIKIGGVVFQEIFGKKGEKEDTSSDSGN